MQKLSKFFPIFIILLLSFWSIKPLFHSGFFPFHDDAQVQRVFEMKTALSDGIFPVRWVPDLGFGYGYPIFTFYAPFVYYIGGILNLTGFDSLTATKIMIGLGMLLAGMSMYVLSREFWGRVGAVVSSLLYVYAPYHAVNLYVRGAVSELWAYGLLPFVFFGIYKIYKNSTDASQAKRNNKKTWLWIIFTSIAYALVIVTHNLTAMMITPFVFVECLFLFLSLPRSQKNYLTAALMFMSLIIGIVLSAFYWLPAVAEMGYTNVNSIIGGGSDYKDHFICLSQLWNSSWGYGGSAPGCLLDGLSFRLGKVHIILASLSLIPLIFTWRSNKNIAYSILL
ncbi:MAG: 6-pyruvoyl-tetrahydropterin synthase-related protein, partial [Candidatus Levyibacteriota bacterium]